MLYYRDTRGNCSLGDLLENNFAKDNLEKIKYNFKFLVEKEKLIIDKILNNTDSKIIDEKLKVLRQKEVLNNTDNKDIFYNQYMDPYADYDEDEEDDYEWYKRQAEHFEEMRNRDNTVVHVDFTNIEYEEEEDVYEYEEYNEDNNLE